MSRVLNLPKFLIYQSSEYASVTQGSEYVWIIPKYAWLCLDMLEMPDYPVIFVNIPKSVNLDIPF